MNCKKKKRKRKKRTVGHQRRKEIGGRERERERERVPITTHSKYNKTKNNTIFLVIYLFISVLKTQQIIQETIISL